MKNQYFGDNRDLFKYDLVTEIMKGFKKSIDKFTFIPMLTQNDNRNDGNERDLGKARAGYKNTRLVKFFKPIHRMSKDRRDFQKIKKYYEAVQIKLEIYNPDKEIYFTHRERLEYFRSINQDLLENALIVIDPDNGLEVKNNSKKHLFYYEVERMYNEIDNRSIIMIFQFFPRVKREKYINYRLSELSRITNNFAFVSDDIITFFFLTRNSEGIEALRKLLTAYTVAYPRCWMAV